MNQKENELNDQTSGMDHAVVKRPKRVMFQFDDCSLSSLEDLIEQGRTLDLDDGGRSVCNVLGFDPTNHHNAKECPYCNPDGHVSAIKEIAELTYEMGSVPDARTIGSQIRLVDWIQRCLYEIMREAKKSGMDRLSVQVADARKDCEKITTTLRSADALAKSIRTIQESVYGCGGTGERRSSQ